MVVSAVVETGQSSLERVLTCWSMGISLLINSSDNVRRKTQDFYIQFCKIVELNSLLENGIFIQTRLQTKMLY